MAKNICMYFISNTIEFMKFTKNHEIIYDYTRFLKLEQRIIIIVPMIHNLFHLCQHQTHVGLAERPESYCMEYPYNSSLADKDECKP